MTRPVGLVAPMDVACWRCGHRIGVHSVACRLDACTCLETLADLLVLDGDVRPISAALAAGDLAEADRLAGELARGLS
jgi:hypothetical protein